MPPTRFDEGLGGVWRVRPARPHVGPARSEHPQGMSWILQLFSVPDNKASASSRQNSSAA